MFNVNLKFEPEAAAAAGLGFDADFAAHAGDGFLDDSEADAGAGVFIAVVEAFEDAENAFAMFRSDADAVVFDPDADEIAVAFFANDDFGSHSFGAEFDGVR